MKKGPAPASPAKTTHPSLMPETDQEKTVLQRLYEVSINPGIVRGEVTEYSDPCDHNDPEIRPLFKVRGKTFNSHEAAAAWVADQERIQAMEAYLRHMGIRDRFDLKRLVALHEIGSLITEHPELVAKALEIRCTPESFVAFADELVLLRNGGF